MTIDQQYCSSTDSTSNDGRLLCSQSNEKSHARKLPHWVKANIQEWEGGTRICMPEWDADESISTDDDEDEVVSGDNDNNGIDHGGMAGDEFDKEDFRRRYGWKGTDLCHSAKYSPVRISHYTVKYKGGVGTILTGLCHFTRQAESHAGYCHGGSMTAAIDDVIGWTAFNALGVCLPWSGHTVQVNVALKCPIPIGSYLKIVGEITKIEGRKVWVHAKLLGENRDEDDGDKAILHCGAEGLVILKKDILASCSTFHVP